MHLLKRQNCLINVMVKNFYDRAEVPSVARTKT